MIGKLPVRTQIHLWLVFFLGLNGCGAGNAKNYLTFEEVSQLKRAPNVYVIHYSTPEFSWWFKTGFLPGFSGYRKYDLIEAREKLKIPLSLKLKDPTITLKHRLYDFAKDQIGLNNLKLISDSFLVENPKKLRQKLGRGKVIDLKTNFWQLFPTYTRQSLDPEEASYQFQSSAYVRFINLDTLSVIHQSSCHYPPQTTPMGQWLQPNTSSLIDEPTWENALRVTELIENNGERINLQILQAIDHCIKEIQKLFPNSL